MISLNPCSETELVFKADIIEQEMIQERLDAEREACVADVEDMWGNEEQQHHQQQQTFDQVDNSCYTVYLSISHDAVMGLTWECLARSSLSIFLFKATFLIITASLNLCYLYLKLYTSAPLRKLYFSLNMLLLSMFLYYKQNYLRCLFDISFCPLSRRFSTVVPQMSLKRNLKSMSFLYLPPLMRPDS